MISKQLVVLSGIGYDVTVQDGQVIFENQFTLGGPVTCFALERLKEINDSPGIWYLTHLEKSYGRIPASHLVCAVKWCEENFGKSFEPYKGELK
jgi:hypothetical protein